MRDPRQPKDYEDIQKTSPKPRDRRNWMQQIGPAITLIVLVATTLVILRVFEIAQDHLKKPLRNNPFGEHRNE